MTKDTSWVKTGTTVRIGEYADPGSDLKFSSNGGAVGSVTSIDGEYATLYIQDNLLKCMPPEERVPLIQLEQL
jgi:hypothetical protein